MMRLPLLPSVHAVLGLFTSAVLFCSALTGRADAAPSPVPTASAAPVNLLFRQFLPRLRRTVHIPILLPLELPGLQEPLVADLGAGDDQYTVSVHQAKAGQRLDFSNQVATISGMRVRPHSHPMGGQSVVLARGQIGRYLGPQKAAPYAFLQWRQAGCVYDLGLIHGTRTQMKAMADWAIRHPSLPERDGAGEK